jgi:hypothetical protein
VQVVALAGRCAERLVLGDANVSTAGAAHLQQVTPAIFFLVSSLSFSLGFSS